MKENRFIIVSDGDTNSTCIGVFAFELEGVVRECQTSSRAESEFEGTTFESLLESLTPQQRITFSFAKQSATGRRARYVWRIIGEVESDSWNGAKKAADRLWESVFLMLLAQRQYRFRPVVDPRPETSLEWWSEVLPRSVQMTPSPGGTGIGFNIDRSPTDIPPAILFPMPDPDPSIQLPIITILSAWPLDMEIRIEISAIPLVGLRRKSMEQLSQSLISQRVEIHLYPEKKTLEEPVASNSMPFWKQMLDYCLSHQSAIVTRIQIGSTTALPPAMLATVGRALFPNHSYEPVENEAREMQPHEEAILDMRNLIHSDRDLLISLLPDPGTIDNLDLPRTFLPPPADIASTGLLLGSMLGQPICQTERDRLRHTYIIGATGTGKSTLLYNMIIQDIQAGKGVCVIDPHGDLYEEVLNSIPDERWQTRKDVVLFNPSDFAWPIGLNVLQTQSAYPEIEHSLLINELIQILDILYDLRQTGGPIFEQYLRNALLLLLGNTNEEFTLIDVPRVFEDEDFREYLKVWCNDRDVVTFWNDQAEKASGDTSLTSLAPYITSKLNQFSHNPVIRQILGQSKSSLNFRELMDDQKILLVNLSKGALSGPDSHLIGMLVIGQIFRAALTRAEIPLHKRKTWHVYIDEFQNFMTDTMSQILSEARKYGLSMVLANQHLAQLDDHRVRANILNAVLGNVANLLFFRLGVLDAERLESYTLPYLKRDDLQFLPDHHVVARLLNHLNPTKPFIFKTHHKWKIEPAAEIETIIEMNRTTYARPSREVHDEIRERQMGAGAPG